jgi:hypothetical protein
VSSAKDFFLEKSQALLSLFDMALLRKKHTTRSWLPVFSSTSLPHGWFSFFRMCHSEIQHFGCCSEPLGVASSSERVISPLHFLLVL